MEFTDMHTHTYMSGHGVGTVEEVVQAAIARGLSSVALTEHMPLPVAIDTNGTFAMTADQVPIYVEDVRRSRDAHPEIEVILGVEIDWREGAESYILEQLASSSPYEILLGSVHMLTDVQGNFWEFDYPPSAGGWLERSEEGVWREYLRLWCDAVNSAVPFTIMTHPDLPKKLGFKPKFDTREYYAAMAETAARRDVLVEVNTSGRHKPVGEMYPAPELLKAFCDAGVGCTVSSDAHKPSEVGRDLTLAHAAMLAAGYKYVTVPTRAGDRRQIQLS
jgi:histidinol-phosphatase (PHP family)